jgi:predicted fused transcriptional regulator/phosphomethylpyrimidine kinase
MSTFSIATKQKGVARLCITAMLSLLLVVQVFAQQKRISGKVTNVATAQPLAKANVNVKGVTGRATVTMTRVVLVYCLVPAKPLL